MSPGRGRRVPGLGWAVGSADWCDSAWLAGGPRVRRWEFSVFRSWNLPWLIEGAIGAKVGAQISIAAPPPLLR